jgi:DNA-3-methyladenine glycosylase II
MNKNQISKRTIPKACRYLKQSCNVMASIIPQYGLCTLDEHRFSPFQTLVNSIISQQLSAKAASSIKQRIYAILYDFTPCGILNVPSDVFRDAGLSSAKIRYIVELAKMVDSGDLDFDKLQNKHDDEIISILTGYSGIGKWTAEMFLIFGLKRINVLSLGDAGLQRAIKNLFGDDVTLESVGKFWSPYCSIASWYLWRTLD